MDAPALAPRWELYSHDADIGIRGFGSTIGAAFEAIGVALTAAVCEPVTVHARTPVTVRCSAADIESLLYDWVNAIVYEMAVRRMLFSRYEAGIDGHELHGTLWGEPLEIRRQDANGSWVAQCVIDV